MSRKHELFCFCLIIVLAVFLRLGGICHDSLWLDESYQSLVGACGHGVPDLLNTGAGKFIFRFGTPVSLSEMLSVFRSVDPLCPPLYATLLRNWIVEFGQSDFALRSLSVLLSVLSIVVLMLFLRFTLGVKVASLAGLLQAVSPYDIHYAQEARMYSLVCLTATLSGASLIAILKTELKNRFFLLLLPLYSLSTWAMVNSHYTTLFFALSQGLAAIVFLVRGAKWRLLFLLSLSWLATLLLWIPWLPMFLKSAGSRKATFYVTRAPDFIWPLKALFWRIPINWLAFLSGQRVTAYAALIYASSVAFLTACAFYFRRDRKSSFVVSALWLWALMPALLLFVVDLIENHRVIEVSRYLIFTSPAVYALAAYGLASIKQKSRPVFSCLLLVHLLFSAVNLFYTHTVKQREPWREMAQSVEQLVDPEQILIISQYYNIPCLDRYLSKPRRQMGMSPAMGKDKIASALAELRSFALVTAQEGESIADMLPEEFKLKKRVDMSHGLHLRIYER